MGGGRYPFAPNLFHAAFGPSSQALAACLVDEKNGIVFAEDWLNLFDNDQSWPDQLIHARNWLRMRTKQDPHPDNIIVHYVGHGWFKRNSEDHLLTINHTDAEEKAATSVALSSFNEMLRRIAGNTRRYYLIDACFAAASVKDLMADNSEVIECQIGQIIRAWPEEAGKSGVAALCSASKSAVASAKGRGLLTQFTDGLISVITTGDVTSDDRISLRRVYTLLRYALNADYSDEMVHPVLVAPNDADGGIAGVPLFINVMKKDLNSVSIDVDSMGNSSIIDLLNSGNFSEGTVVTVSGPEEAGGLTKAGEGMGQAVMQKSDRQAKVTSEPDMPQNMDAVSRMCSDFLQLVYRFFRLSPSQKEEIIKGLELGHQEDVTLPQQDRFKKVLKRAHIDGKTKILEKLIEDAELCK